MSNTSRSTSLPSCYYHYLPSDTIALFSSQLYLSVRQLSIDTKCTFKTFKRLFLSVSDRNIPWRLTLTSVLTRTCSRSLLRYSRSSINTFPGLMCVAVLIKWAGNATEMIRISADVWEGYIKYLRDNCACSRCKIFRA